MPIEARHILISGFVQGVGYRAWAERNAQELELVGWVRNLQDGRVDAHVEGYPERLVAFIKLCARGPTYAAIETVDAQPTPTQGLREFKVARTASTPNSRPSFPTV